MLALTDWLRPRWPVLAFAASALMLAAAHGFERFLGLAPCPLCLDQRERHWVVLSLSAALFALTLLVKKPGLTRIAAALIGLAFAWSFYEAGHHVAVEQKWIPATCEARIDPDSYTVTDWDAPVSAPACDTPAWTLFGISMAGYNALISLALMLASFAIAAAPNLKAEHGRKLDHG